MRLFEGDTPIQVLHLNILYVHHRTMTVDLSFVEHIKRPVDRLEVTISETTVTIEDPAFEPDTVQAVKKEVARVGALVVSKKGRLTMEKVLGSVNKTILDESVVSGGDGNGSGVVPYLPLNELNRGTAATTQQGN